MAAPSITLGSNYNTDTAGTSHSVGLPSGTAEKFVWIATYSSSGAHTVSATDWTVVFSDITATGKRFTLLRSDSAISATSVSISTTASTMAAAIGGSTDGDLASISSATFATGTGSTPDPPNISSLTSGDYRIIAVCGWMDARRSISVYPTNYSDNNSNPKNDGNNEPVAAIATRGMTSITSENPGTFTINGGSHSWLAQTFAIPAAGGASHTQAADATTTITAALATVKTGVVAAAATTTVTADLAQVRSFFRTLDATTTVTAALSQVRSFFRTLAATTTVTAAVTKMVSKTLEATTTFTGDLVTTLIFGRTLDATTTFTAALSTVSSFKLTLNATTTFTAGIVKAVSKNISYSMTVTAEVVKKVSKTLAATTAFTAAANVAYIAVRVLDATVTFIGDLATVHTPAGPEDTTTKRFSQAVARFGRTLRGKG